MRKDLKGPIIALEQNSLFFTNKGREDQKDISEEYKEFAIQLEKLGLDQGDKDKIMNIVSSHNERQPIKK